MAWEVGKQMLLDPIRRNAFQLRHSGSIPLQWCRGMNWGDALSPVLVKALSGRNVVHTEALHQHRILAIGSILGAANLRSEVWGSGFIRAGEKVISAPKAIYAVRGPLTRKMLVDQGINCPEIYGDPALLLPKIFDPDVSVEYELGVIPHYIDKNREFIRRCRLDPNILVIDIEDGIESFVKAVKSCEMIASSSLHGLICADAYERPNVWIQLSDDVEGGAFKFQDYRSSVGASVMDPVRVTDEVVPAVVSRRVELVPLEIDLGALLLACPFLSEDLDREARDSLRLMGRIPDVFACTKLSQPPHS